jgi:hypothetical protein
MGSERRTAVRVPAQIYLTQYVNDEPHRCFTVNLSASGIFVNKLIEPLARRSSIVQVELPLPGGDTIWAKGDVMYDSFDPYFHSMGVRLISMARAHKRMLFEYVHESYMSGLKRMMQDLRVGVRRSIA